MIKCKICDGWGMLSKEGNRLPASIRRYRKNTNGIIKCPHCQGTGETKTIKGV